MRLTIVLMIVLGAPALAQDQPVEESAEPEASSQTEAAAEAGESGARSMLGMSILGNEEAPKSLVIVPWKSSQIGEGLGVSNSMNDSAIPVDREVFMREIRYYELRSGGAQQ